MPEPAWSAPVPSVPAVVPSTLLQRRPDIAAAEDYHGPQQGFAVYEAAYIANGNWTPEKAGDEGWRQVVRAYFAAISHVDHELGRFIDALEASPLGDKTTVIFAPTASTTYSFRLNSFRPEATLTLKIFCKAVLHQHN